VWPSRRGATLTVQVSKKRSGRLSPARPVFTRLARPRGAIRGR
jgi:hypothetical protein